MQVGVILQFDQQGFNLAGVDNALVKSGDVKIAQTRHKLGNGHLVERVGDLLAGHFLHGKQFLPQVGDCRAVALFQNIAVNVGYNVGNVDGELEVVVGFFQVDVAVEHPCGAPDHFQVAFQLDNNVDVLFLCLVCRCLIPHSEIERGQQPLKVIGAEVFQLGNDLPNGGDNGVEIEFQEAVASLSGNFVAGKQNAVDADISADEHQADQLGILLFGQRLNNGVQVVGQLVGKNVAFHLFEQVAHSLGILFQKGEDVIKVDKVLQRKGICGIANGGHQRVHQVAHRNDQSVLDNLCKGAGLAVLGQVGQVSEVALQKQGCERLHIQIIHGERLQAGVIIKAFALARSGKELIPAAMGVHNGHDLINGKQVEINAQPGAQEGVDVGVLYQRARADEGDDVFQRNEPDHAVVVQRAEDGVGKVGGIIVCFVGNKVFQVVDGNAEMVVRQKPLKQGGLAGLVDRLRQNGVERVRIKIDVVGKDLLDLLVGQLGDLIGVRLEQGFVTRGIDRRFNACDQIVAVVGKQALHNRFIDRCQIKVGVFFQIGNAVRVDGRDQRIQIKVFQGGIGNVFVPNVDRGQGLRLGIGFSGHHVPHCQRSPPAGSGLGERRLHRVRVIIGFVAENAQDLVDAAGNVAQKVENSRGGNGLFQRGFVIILRVILQHRPNLGGGGEKVCQLHHLFNARLRKEGARLRDDGVKVQIGAVGVSRAEQLQNFGFFLVGKILVLHNHQRKRLSAGGGDDVIIGILDSCDQIILEDLFFRVGKKLFQLVDFQLISGRGNGQPFGNDIPRNGGKKIVPHGDQIFHNAVDVFRFNAGRIDQVAQRERIAVVVFQLAGVQPGKQFGNKGVKIREQRALFRGGKLRELRFELVHIQILQELVVVNIQIQRKHRRGVDGSFKPFQRRDDADRIRQRVAQFVVAVVVVGAGVIRVDFTRDRSEHAVNVHHIHYGVRAAELTDQSCKTALAADDDFQNGIERNDLHDIPKGDQFSFRFHHGVQSLFERFGVAKRVQKV